MATANSDAIWKMMKVNNFEMIGELSNDMMCSICKNMMTNACTGVCGCKYCLRCIQNFLIGGNKFCPGGLQFCNDEMIDIDKNINIDQALNYRIMRTVVKCPHKPCKHQDELRNIEDHLRTCESRPVECPYFNVGCDKDKLVRDKMKDHLEIGNYGHTKLLIEFVDNLRNEMELLKRENVELKEKSNDQEKEMAIVKLEGKRIQDALLELQSNSNDASRQIETRRRKPNKRDESIKSNDERTENLDRRMAGRPTDHDNQKRCEFEWVIENILDKINRARNGNDEGIFSDAFDSHQNGYKMCLSLYANGFGAGKGSHLTVSFCIMRGLFDDILSWPFKGGVTISLMNQHSGLVQVNWTIKYEEYPTSPKWRKPISERNAGVGYAKFIKIDHLLSNADLIKNDKIIIKCLVTIPYQL